MSGSEFPRTLRCAHCGTEFEPDEARSVRVIGPATALYQCPSCGRFERSIPPQDGESASLTGGARTDSMLGVPGEVAFR